MEDLETPPSFPFPIFVAASIKDTLDLFLTMTGIGIPVVLPITGAMSVIVTVWALQRGSSLEAWRKKSRRSMWRRWAVSMFGEFLPFIDALPFTAWFVYSTYRTERKAYVARNTDADA